jgi:general secretion pathway protein D
MMQIQLDQKTRRYLGTYLFTLWAVLLLSGCGGMWAYRDANALFSQGKTEQGMARLEEAVRLEPKNAEYRIALSVRRTSFINRLLSSAETARRAGQLTEAEKAYRQVQGVDPENVMARQGMDALAKERKHRAMLAEVDGLLKKGAGQDLLDAQDKLRLVLSENPGQREAQNLKLRVDEALLKEPKAEMRLAASFRKPISLEFRDAPLRSILEVVAKVAEINFFYDKDIRPDLKATVFAKNTTIEDAVRLLLVTNQLEQKVLSENSILIYPNTPQKLKDYQTLAVRSFYLTNADVKAVSNTLKTIVKTKDLVVDERLGIIIMRDTPEAIRMAERIVALQDLSDPEVMLEVEILEIKRSRLMELGVQWPSQMVLSPLKLATATGTGATTASTTTVNDLLHLSSDTTQATVGSTLVNLRKEDSDANILANPRIRVRNKEKAKVQIGDRVPVITTTSTSTGFVSESVNYVDVGLKLEVEPNIFLDEEVAIKINLEVSNLVREILSKSGSLSYQIGTRGANTTLRLKDGETQILAGLISDEDRSTANKMPGLGEIPVLGRLFGSQKDDAQRSEILLSITPRIVRSIRRPDMLAAEFESGTEAVIGAPSLRLTTLEAPASESKDGAKVGAASSPNANSKASATPSTNSSSAGSAPSASGAAASGLGLKWQGPAQVKVGEQFSVVLNVSSQQPLNGMPALIGFDPQVMQIVSVQEGDFFKQGKAQTSFSQRVDPVQGKAFVALVRQAANGADAGINGAGSLISATFKALKATSAAKIQLLSATPEPAPTVLTPFPIDHAFIIAP